MTGEYGFRTGVGAAIPPSGGNGLEPNGQSLFDVLEQSDYATNLIGKWHLADNQDKLDQPKKFNVDDYWGLFKGGIKDYFTWTAIHDAKRESVDEYATTAITNRALDWIGEQQQPWFLWLAYNAPHTPFHIPPQNLHSAGELNDDPQYIKSHPLAYYNAMLEALDSEMGRLLSSLEPKVRENTVVMFIGDNGSPNQVTRGLYGDHAAKGTIYDSGTHVPFIVSGANIRADRTQAFVQTTDLYTTIASFAGVKAVTPDAYNFQPVFAGKPAQRDYIYVEHFSDDKSQAKPKDVFGWALRMEDYKLLQPDGQPASLFNLADDPKEQVDLLADGVSDQEQKIVDQLQQRFNEIRAQ